GEGAPGGVDLVEGTVNSFNTLYAQLVLKVGPGNAIDMAKKLGITTPLDVVPAAVLGSNDVRPLEMASVYGTLANRGVHVDPVMITKVSDARGNVIYEAPRTSEKAIDASVADQVSSVLQQVIERGTGTAAKLTRPAAGKTGTGEDFKNAWFCGYTRQLATAVWVGFGQDERTQMQPPNTSITVYGGTWPAEIWQRFMTAALSGVTPIDFVAPSAPTALPSESTTTTTAALGPPTDVPSVVGLDATAAADLLGRHALRAFTVQVDDPTKAGTVTRQSPAAGTQAPENSTVTIQVARGAPGPSAPAGSAVVPSVVGRSRADAGAALNAAGFAVVASDVPESEIVPSSRRGLVWRQTPPGGQTAPLGSLVAIDVNP
ncbi:MAG: PASTA domain-containing protein, partial [Acidimicrobiales bacterium]